MSYLTQNEIASSRPMLDRIAQAAASEHVANPDQWAYDHRRQMGAAPGWDEAWVYAKNVHPEPEYDPGSDEAVVTDAMILAEVQAALQAPPG